ncbi:MAG: HEAT repeat domain-containing protein [Chloroflexi bacterium]|nr:HEAT repeat domain-containing protein [Chloroflexota bacterium]
MTDGKRKLIGDLADADAAVRGRAMSGLGIGDQSDLTAFLIDCLSSVDREVGWAAKWCLCKVGDSDTVSLLAETMNNGSVIARERAALVLGELQGDEARELLLAALDDWSAHVSGAALEALCKFDDPDLMSHYIAAFRPGDEVLCSAAIGVVERLKDERAVPALLDSGIKDLRLESTWALEAIGGPRVLKAAIPLLKDRDRPVRESAADIVVHIGGDEGFDALIEALPYLGKPYLELPFMWDDGYWNLARRLVNMGGARGLSRLAHALTDWPDRHLSSAEWALDRLRKPGMVEQFLKEFEGGNRCQRRYAAYGLGVLGDMRAFEPLLRSLQSRWDCVVAAAAEALGRLGDDRAVEPLAALVPNEDLGVRAATAASLGRLGTARAIEPLTRLMIEEDDIEISGMAREALARLREVTTKNDGV